jgi:hypothetical protein
VAPIDTASAQAYSGKASQLELPEISAIVDGRVRFTDLDGDPNDEKVQIPEVEIAFQGALHPSVHGDLIVAVEQEYDGTETHTEIHIEEAYLSFLDLPLGLQGLVGRRLMGFGRLNSIHPHHWAFTDTPLVLDQLFGDHPWMDDGAQLSYLIPNPADLYIKVTVGVWNGNALGHHHGEEDAHDEEEHEEHEEHAEHDEHEEGHGQAEPVEWDGHVFTGRLFVDLPVTERLSVEAGGSLAIDEGDNRLSAADIVFRYRWPKTFQRVKWQTEWFRFDDDDTGSDASGIFSFVQFTLDKYWETTVRYDWTELLHDSDETATAISGYVSYYLTHTTYLRGGYQLKEHANGDDENIVNLQFVWGIGPHSHRLED